MRSLPVAPERPSRPVPLGVHVRDGGVDVAVLASHATGVDLCLIDETPDGWQERRIALPGPRLGVFSAHVPDVGAGQRYGFRAHGPWDPAAGLRYNPAKLLLDPYARGVLGRVAPVPQVYGHVVDDQLRGDPFGAADPRDSLPYVPHAVVLDGPTAGLDPAANRPWVSWSDTVLYEAHVRGLTYRMESLPPELRGTYAGLAHPATLAHLRGLGITALELLPIQASAPEPHLVTKGLTNYWGYNTLGFFAPEPRYATAAARAAGPGAVLDELRAAVHALHAAGIEVILDVVYNHTCEGGVEDPHLSWRGLDNSVYYLHEGSTPATLVDVTGCGNTLDFRRRAVVRMATDSVRYWAQQVGVDGFRFDLAVTTARGADGFSSDHAFLVGLATDPALDGLKLIAEPWDLGPGGWRTGEFPPPMAEWNDRFRDAVRSFWLAEPSRAAQGMPGERVRELATRLAGSVDIFGHSDPPLMRGPVASINYVAAHDGFTVADLVTYEHKHNDANGEHNRDGTDDNRSWNHGIEGPVRQDSVGLEILPLRRRSIRNLLATLLLAAGTPMLVAGDELGRTQHGNNNAYCQDNEVSWVDWRMPGCRRDLLATTQHLLGLRRQHRALRTSRFYTGRPGAAGGPRDLVWLGADGTELDQARWFDFTVRTLQMARTAPSTPTEPESSVLIVINGSLDPVPVAVGPGLGVSRWELVWDSTWEHPDERRTAAVNGALHPQAGDAVMVDGLSIRVYTASPEQHPVRDRPALISPPPFDEPPARPDAARGATG